MCDKYISICYNRNDFVNYGYYSQLILCMMLRMAVNSKSLVAVDRQNGGSHGLQKGRS